MNADERAGVPNIRGECPPHEPWLSIRRRADRVWSRKAPPASPETDRDEMLSDLFVALAEHFPSSTLRRFSAAFRLPSTWPPVEGEEESLCEDAETIRAYAAGIARRLVADYATGTRRRGGLVSPATTGDRASPYLDTPDEGDGEAGERSAGVFAGPCLRSPSEDAMIAAIDRRRDPVAAFWSDVHAWAAEEFLERTGEAPPALRVVLLSKRTACELRANATEATLLMLVSGFRPLIDVTPATEPRAAFDALFSSVRKVSYRLKQSCPPNGTPELDLVGGSELARARSSTAIGSTIDDR